MIYLQTMSDVARAISATANATTGAPEGGGGGPGILAGTAAEAHVYLSEDMIEE